MRITLTSQPPRKEELLVHIVPELKIEPADIDEAPSPDKLPVNYVRGMAEGKARTVWEQKEKKDNLVITSNTAVALSQGIMDRPEDMAEAEVMLKKLSGETHTVYTAVALKTKERKERVLAKAHATFYPLTDKEINRYLETGDYADKAGTYGIQNAASTFVREIFGGYYNIVGFPIDTVNQALKTFN